jgi:hypothetical protein
MWWDRRRPLSPTLAGSPHHSRASGAGYAPRGVPPRNLMPLKAVGEAGRRLLLTRILQDNLREFVAVGDVELGACTV